MLPAILLHSAKRRTYSLLTLVAALMVLAALVIGGPAPSGQVAGAATVAPAIIANCVQTTVVGTDNCSFTTTTAVAAGGAMTIEVTNPVGATITAVVPAPPVGCAALLPPISAVFTLACAVASIGMPAGITFTEAVTGVSATTQFITQTVVYNANGAAPQVGNPTTESACAPNAGSPPPPPPPSPPPPLPVGTGSYTFACAPTVTTVGGGTLVVSISAPPAPGANVQITTAPNVVGAPLAPCFLQTALPSPAAPGGVASITYLCATGASFPVPNVVGQLLLAGITAIENAGIASATVTENANGAIQNIIPFPELLNFGPCSTPWTGLVGGQPQANSSTSACPVGPLPFAAAIAQAGETLAFQITASVAQTIFVAAGGAPLTIPGPPGSGVSCALTTPLPTSVTQPEGTLTINYTCSTNQVAQTPLPPPSPITITNGNGVNGVAIITEAVIPPGPPPGIPAPTTNSITFTIAGISSAPVATGTPVIAGATPTPPPTAVGGGPPVSGAGGFCSGATPTSGCVTFNTNCVNPARVTLPAQPAAGLPPAVSANGPYHGNTGEPTTFFGAASPAAGAAGAAGPSIVSCKWDFGDGTSSRFIGPTHMYTRSGPYTATLTITDSTGKISSDSTIVLVAPLGPLCQQTNFLPLFPPPGPAGPTTGPDGGLSPCFNTLPGCLPASFNNGCQPTCPLTGETLLPGQCLGPGPVSGSTNTNQIWLDGPYQRGINEPLQVTVNTNLPGTSPLLAGDSITFNFGDSAVVTNTPPPSYTVGSPGLPAVLAPATGPTTGTVAIVAGPIMPAQMQATHAYTHPGTYTIKVTITFSDGSQAVAQTTVTVSGTPASVTTASSLPPASITTPGNTTPGVIPLAAGCNIVNLTFPDGTAIQTVVAAIQGTNVISISESPANAPPLAYYPNLQDAGNLAAVSRGDTATICVSNSGNLYEPLG